MVVTDDDDLALRLRLIRNHAEAVVGEMGVENIDNMLGWNYRMTELEAAVAYEQLQKMDRLNSERRHLAEHLTQRLQSLPGILPPQVREGCEHVGDPVESDRAEHARIAPGGPDRHCGEE